MCVLHLIPNFFLQKLLLVPNTLWVIMVQQSVHSKAFIPKRFQAFPSVPSVSKRFQAFSPTKRSSWSNKARLVQRWSNKRWSNDGPTKRGWSNKARFWSSWSNKARFQQSAVLVIMVQQSALPFLSFSSYSSSDILLATKIKPSLSYFLSLVVPSCKLSVVMVKQLSIGMARTIFIYGVYTVYIQYFWQGNYKMCGHIRCIYTVLASPNHQSRHQRSLPKVTP